MDKEFVVGAVRESGSSVKIEIVTPSGDVRKVRMTPKLWEKFAYKSADVISSVAFSRIIKVGEACEAVTKALRLIADSPYSYRSLEIKLKKSGFSSDSVDAAMTTVRKKGLIDEDSQAAQAAEKYVTRSLRGPSRIKADLVAHGYPADVADRAAAGVPEELYDEALEKNIAKKGIPEDQAGRDRLTASLARLGFPISKIIDKMEKHP